MQVILVTLINEIMHYINKNASIEKNLNYVNISIVIEIRKLKFVQTYFNTYKEKNEI